MNRDEAEAILRAAIEADWTVGTFHIDAVYESADSFALLYGSREFLVDENPRFMAFDVPVATVSKRTRAIVYIPRVQFREEWARS